MGQIRAPAANLRSAFYPVNPRSLRVGISLAMRLKTTRTRRTRSDRRHASASFARVANDNPETTIALQPVY